MSLKLQITNIKIQTYKIYLSFIWILFIVCNLLIVNRNLYAEDAKEEPKVNTGTSAKGTPVQPITINGDRVEYSTNNREVTVTGNAEVIYKGAKLTCDRLTVNTTTKEGVAEGNARLQDQQGVIVGKKIQYNFETKKGIISDADFRSNPYFGKAAKAEKVSDKQFIVYNTFMSTCNLDKPHYGMASKKTDFFPDDKIVAKGNKFYLGKVPILYMPQFSRSLKDMNLHIQTIPGNSKDWGPYLLNVWRYNLTPNFNARIYLDYRSKLGIAEGFGAYYHYPELGNGDFKFYYTQERDKSDDIDQKDVNVPKVFQRYMLRWRHKLDIDKATNLIFEYNKLVDSKKFVAGSQFNLLKDYFFREYEKDSAPLSYFLFHHAFRYSNLDVFIQKRINLWYSQLEILPQVLYNLPNNRLGNSPFYFEHTSQGANFTFKHAVPSPSSDDIKMARFDTTNKFSMPLKVAFISFTPYVKNEETYYSSEVTDKTGVWRTIFYSGADLSTKFYRIFNFKTNLLGLNLNGVRHIITPTVGYAFNKEPTITKDKLKQIDGIDSITRNNSATFQLSNKLQTKREGLSVDLVDFRIDTSYLFKPKNATDHGSRFSDILFYLEMRPYSWMRVVSDATYKHSGARDDDGYNSFTNVNYDIYFDLGKERTVGLGQRYQLKGGNLITFSFDWRLTPKWKFGFYQSRDIGNDPAFKRGLREQQYTVTRDLHCWEADLTYDSKFNRGNSIWLVFRLKAFPEMEFNVEQSYHKPKPGSQELTLR